MNNYIAMLLGTEKEIHFSARDDNEAIEKANNEFKKELKDNFLRVRVYRVKIVNERVYYIKCTGPKWNEES